MKAKLMAMCVVVLLAIAMSEPVHGLERDRLLNAFEALLVEGVGVEQIQEGIRHGVRKVNIDTEGLGAYRRGRARHVAWSRRHIEDH